jgi:hypothetical protein
VKKTKDFIDKNVNITEIKQGLKNIKAKEYREKNKTIINEKMKNI